MGHKTLSKTDVKRLEKACGLAVTSPCEVWKHGALIVKGGRTLGSGTNKDRNRPDIVTNPKANAAIHAEAAAIRACGETDLRGATIYVARVNKAGEKRMSRPCVRCQALLKSRGIKKVVYTIDSSLLLV